MPIKNYYEILELNSNASEQEISKAYRRLALKWHPDKNPGNAKEAEKRFVEVAEAYEILSNKEKKKLYDDQLIQNSSNNYNFNDDRSNNNYRTFSQNFREPESTFDNQFSNPQKIFEKFFGTRNIFEIYEENEFLDPQKTQRELNPNSSLFPNFSRHNKNSSSFKYSTINFSDSDSNKDFKRFSSFKNNREPGIGSNSSSSKSTTVSKKIINGKSIVTTKIIENGNETIIEEENGFMKSKTVNGVPQFTSFKS
jgi:curved DNA-binding protein CbpA